MTTEFTPTAPAGIASPPAPASLSLYAISAELTAWFDTIELTEEGSPERAECEQAIERYMEQLPAKADSIGAFLAHLEWLQEFAGAEIKRLQNRKQHFERAQERLEQYCVRVLQQLPEPKKGARKIEGSNHTLSLHPSQVVILLDESKIPIEYKTVSIRLPAPAWESLAEAHPEILNQLLKREFETRKDELKKVLKAGAVIPGCDLEFRYSLARR